MQKLRNGLGTIVTVLAQGFESLLEAMTLVLALLRGVANCILLKNGAYSGFFMQDPLDNSPDRKMMMANHAEKHIVPPFTNVVRSVAVPESGLMHIPYRRWKEWWCAAKSEVCGVILGSHHLEAPTYIVLVKVVNKFGGFWWCIVLQVSQPMGTPPLFPPSYVLCQDGWSCISTAEHTKVLICSAAAHKYMSFQHHRMEHEAHKPLRTEQETTFNKACIHHIFIN